MDQPGVIAGAAVVVRRHARRHDHTRSGVALDLHVTIAAASIAPRRWWAEVLRTPNGRPRWVHRRRGVARLPGAHWRRHRRRRSGKPTGGEDHTSLFPSNAADLGATERSATDRTSASCRCRLFRDSEPTPGTSGDSTSWEGWSHGRWFNEEVSACLTAASNLKSVGSHP